MRRFWRWVLFRLRLRPTHWRVKIHQTGNRVTIMLDVASRKGATTEDVNAASAEAWRYACRLAGGRRTLQVTGTSEETGPAALAAFNGFPGRAS